MSNFVVRKVAVLGAGVMGAQIAAHCVNARVPVVLFDLPAKEGPKNGIVEVRLANIVHSLGKVLLRFREATRSSAFANADSSVLLVDVPDPATIGETCRC